jgi:hypothetical protein
MTETFINPRPHNINMDNKQNSNRPPGGRHYLKNITGITYRQLIEYCTRELAIGDIPRVFIEVKAGQAWLCRT